MRRWAVAGSKTRNNGEKVKQNKVLQYLVGNVVEVGKTPSRRIAYNYSSPIRFSMVILK
jgi:hypothetical protein